MENQEKPKRQFLGKTENFKDKQEKRFNQRMLKAYLKGHKYFHFGFEYAKDVSGIIRRFPKRHDVLQNIN